MHTILWVLVEGAIINTINEFHIAKQSNRTLESAQKNHLARVWFALSACSAYSYRQYRQTNVIANVHKPWVCFVLGRGGRGYFLHHCPSFAKVK
jgi:hypothetical protein